MRRQLHQARCLLRLRLRPWLWLLLLSPWQPPLLLQLRLLLHITTHYPPPDLECVKYLKPNTTSLAASSVVKKARMPMLVQERASSATWTAWQNNKGAGDGNTCVRTKQQPQQRGRQHKSPNHRYSNAPMCGASSGVG